MSEKKLKSESAMSNKVSAKADGSKPFQKEEHDISEHEITEHKSENDNVGTSHNMSGLYAVLQETNEAEMETWLYFIKYEGNEKNLEHLKKQLESFESVIIEDCSTFDIDTEHLVSAQTAKEMTKVELNAHQWHRKFDGKLEKIKLKFKDDDDNEAKMIKIFDKLGYGQIENYIDDEDIDSCDLTDCGSSDESDDSSDDSSSDQEHSPPVVSKIEGSKKDDENNVKKDDKRDKKTEKTVSVPSSIKKKK
jgi:hypothetical protein